MVTAVCFWRLRKKIKPFLHGKLYRTEGKIFTKHHGRNSQNFLRKIRKIFLTVRSIWGLILNRKWLYFIIFILGNIDPKWNLAQISTISLKNFKISSPKVQNILKSLLKLFCEFEPCRF